MFYNTNTREYTCKLLDAVDASMIDPKGALAAALSYMSEKEVEDMCRVNQFFLDEEEEVDFEDEVDY